MNQPTTYYQPHTIVLVLMRTGDFILGKYEAPATDLLPGKLVKPRRMLVQPLPSGQASIQLIPVGAPFFTDDDYPSMDFPGLDLAMMHKKAPEELKNAYIQQTSGIRLAGVSGLMPKGLPS